MRKFFVLLLLAQLAAAELSAKDRDTIYQTSTIDALLAGVYDGHITLGELKQYGDFGIGTFQALEGEMIMLDGRVYQARADGTMHEPPPETGTPFATITWLDRDLELESVSAASLADLTAKIDQALPKARLSSNLFYAVRVDGVFEKISVRSVPKQTRPYRPLLQIVKAEQAVFDFQNVKGTLVGFRCPPFVQGINAPGYHLHFISADRQQGGHVLDLCGKDLHVILDQSDSLLLVLPATGDFSNINLGDNRQEELHRVETAPGK